MWTEKLRCLHERKAFAMVTVRRGWLAICCLLPTFVGGKKRRVLCYVIGGSAPILLGRPVMKKFGMVVDYEKDQVMYDGIGWQPLELGPKGEHVVSYIMADYSEGCYNLCCSWLTFKYTYKCTCWMCKCAYMLDNFHKFSPNLYVSSLVGAWNFVVEMLSSPCRDRWWKTWEQMFLRTQLQHYVTWRRSEPGQLSTSAWADFGGHLWRTTPSSISTGQWRWLWTGTCYGRRASRARRSSWCCADNASWSSTASSRRTWTITEVTRKRCVYTSLPMAWKIHMLLDIMNDRGTWRRRIPSRESKTWAWDCCRDSSSSRSWWWWAYGGWCSFCWDSSAATTSRLGDCDCEQHAGDRWGMAGSDDEAERRDEHQSADSGRTWEGHRGKEEGADQLLGVCWQEWKWLWSRDSSLGADLEGEWPRNASGKSKVCTERISGSRPFQSGRKFTDCWKIGQDDLAGGGNQQRLGAILWRCQISLLIRCKVRKASDSDTSKRLPSVAWWTAWWNFEDENVEVRIRTSGCPTILWFPEATRRLILLKFTLWTSALSCTMEMMVMVERSFEEFWFCMLTTCWLRVMDPQSPRRWFRVFKRAKWQQLKENEMVKYTAEASFINPKTRWSSTLKSTSRRSRRSRFRRDLKKELDEREKSKCRGLLGALQWPEGQGVPALCASKRPGWRTFFEHAGAFWFSKNQPLAATCSHLLPAATCSHLQPLEQPLAATCKWLQVAARKNHYIFRRKQPNSFKFISINFIRKEWLQVAARKNHYIFWRKNNGKVLIFSIKFIRKEWLQVAARKSHYIFRRTNNGKVLIFSINFIRKEWLLEASGCKWLRGKITLFSGEKTTEKF